MLLNAEDSILLVVDLQPSFLGVIDRGEAVVDRCLFLAKAARTLGVPIFATEQNPSRMGATLPQLADLLTRPALPKMAFSCFGAAGLDEAIRETGRETVILCGIETHICVTQTTGDLLSRELWPVLAADAISARSLQMHESGMARMIDHGASAAHSESIVYEWMRTAEHPAFRDVLQIVKAHPAS